MPAGDAGLDRQPEIDRLREQVAEWESAHAAVVELRGLIESHMDMARGQWRCVAQLAAQQAVVEQKTRLNHQLAAECVERHYDQHRLRDQIAALVAWIRTRQHIESDSLTDEQILSAVNGWAELQAQAAQPEGEQA